MKKFITLILSITLFSCFTVAETVSAAAANSGFYEVVKVYILAGQSNMDGRASTSALPPELKASRTDIPTYFIDQWRDLQPGFNEGLNPSMIGPEITFGRSMLEKNEYRKIALIKSSKGATSLYADWKPQTGPQWIDMVEDVNDAMVILSKDYNPVIVGFIWMQGEWDALFGQTLADAYEQNLTNFIAAVRTTFSVPNLPFIIGQISESPAWVYGSTVRQAQLNVSQNVADTALVITSDLPLAGDNYHYVTSSMIELGYRFANEMDKLDKDVYTPIYLNYLKYITKDWTIKLSADVYFGHNFDDVNDANTSSPAYVGNFSNNSYLPETLALNNRYYWRVDEIDANGLHKGDTWQFTTGNNNSNIGWWKLDRSTQDLSGYFNDGVAFGQPKTTNDPNWAKCISFDGENDYIQIPNESVFDLATDMTIAAWVRLETEEEGTYTIVSKGESFWFFMDTYAKATVFFCDGLGQPVQSSLNIFDGKWHHVAAVYDGSERAIYVDGIKDASSSSTASIVLNDNNLLIGNNELCSDNNKFNGEIREVRIYSGRLSDSEIFSLSKTNNYSPKPFNGQENVSCENALVFSPKQWMRNIIGDLNNDFIVDFKDFAIYANDWIVN